MSYNDMYEFWIAGNLMPVTPSSVTVKINNKNRTLDLIDGSEINVMKSPGLTDISFTLMLPVMDQYPWARYLSVFKPPHKFLDMFERFKTLKQSFQFIIVRGDGLETSNFTVSLEDYSINEDADQGRDVFVDITLKQYKYFGTREAKVVTETEDTVEIQEETSPREEQNSPEPKVKAKQYTVAGGDCLWNIALKYYGDGTKWEKIRDANPDIIPANSTMIHPNQTLVIPPLS